MPVRRRALLVGLAGTAGCAGSDGRADRDVETVPAGSSTTPPATSPAPATPASQGPVAASSSRAAPSAGPSPTSDPGTSSRPASAGADAPSLRGDALNAWAYAPVADPGALVVEGAAPLQRAWSTSKVLVVAAVLEQVAGGRPERLTARLQAQVTAVLTASDLTALRELKAAAGGPLGARMTAILRSVGDVTTVAPDSLEGTMAWSVGDQVRFMAALARRRVVSPETSAYVLAQMQPVVSQRWGLPLVGATATKGGWLRADTETRQMGILGGFAVAILTAGVGPAVPQSDGDLAHEQQMTTLAEQLRRRLAV